MDHTIQQQTLANLATRSPQNALVFDKYHIDYYCHGHQSLETTCTTLQLNKKRVLQELASVATSSCALHFVDCSGFSVFELLEHIETSHHSITRKTLSAMVSGLENLVVGFGSDYPLLEELLLMLQALQAELLQHLQKEEQMLFPTLRRNPDIRALPTEIMQDLEFEHRHAGSAVRHLFSTVQQIGGELTDNLCWRHFKLELAYFAADMRQHIHKENNILFCSGSPVAGY